MLRYRVIGAALVVMLLGVGRPSWAEEVVLEHWRCFSNSDYNMTEPLLILTRYRGAAGEYGVVYLPGVEPITTAFDVVGLNRRWDWELRTGGYRYAVVVDIDGGGGYYDFGSKPESVTPSMRFKCKTR